ncbi:hypothetical protein [Streptomyces sp. NPDC101206]|uniref:hypothetical protein n=1 Tax=Streptomyces sp. NPDC101206 TaxID=3366128 RepID=UPI0037F9AE77
MTVTRAGKAQQSWDDFKRTVRGQRTELIAGVEVPVPTDVPLLFEEMANSLSEASAESDFAEVVDLLYGAGVFAQWKAAGMGAVDLMTVLTWGFAQASGLAMTFSEAYEVVTSDDPGKALAQARPGNRAARRQQSAATGGRSKPTSRASTATTRRPSRA